MNAPSLEITETIELPYVEGEVCVKENNIYDDSVDVTVQHQSYGQPAASIIFSPGGPSLHTLLGFDPAGLRKLGNFLIRASHIIEDEAKRQRKDS